MASSNSAKPFQAFGALVPPGAQVEPFQVQQISQGRPKAYSEIKESFRADFQRSGSRFHLSEYVAGQLSVEEEELRRFESMVEEETARRVNELKEAAQNEGFEKGFADGNLKGLSESRVSVEEQLTLLKACIEDLDSAKVNLANQYEKEFTHLALKLASVLTYHEVQSSPEQIHFTISEMLERVAKSDDVIVKMSKSYSSCLDTIKKELDTAKNIDRRIQFELEAALEPGDVIVECLSGEVASFLKEKITLLESVLLENIEARQGVPS